jgi:hypothetical protein
MLENQIHPLFHTRCTVFDNIVLVCSCNLSTCGKSLLNITNFHSKIEQNGKKKFKPWGPTPTTIPTFNVWTDGPVAVITPTISLRRRERKRMRKG